MDAVPPCVGFVGWLFGIMDSKPLIGGQHSDIEDVGFSIPTISIHGIYPHIVYNCIKYWCKNLGIQPNSM